MREDLDLFWLQKQPVRTEEEITRNWGGNLDPIVSICCPTFNQVAYIEDAIRGFLAQETTFPFEIIIRDDASTDGTTNIVRDYSKRYPKIIRAIINEENRYSQGEAPYHVLTYIIRGKYVTFCEGDDFWISSTMLQKEFELLEAHPESVMAVARTYQCRQHNDEFEYERTYGEIDKKELVSEEDKNIYFHTSSLLMKTDIFKEIMEKYFMGHTLYGDWALRAFLATKGSYVNLPEVVSVYRMTGNGLWSSLDDEERLIHKLYQTKKLASQLSGRHSRRQRRLFYRHLIKLLHSYFCNGRFKDVVKLLWRVSNV